MDYFEIDRPDDWHLHLRDGEMLQRVAGYSAGVFGRAIVMPNLKPPVTSVAAAHAYRERILAALPADTRFEPLMTLYLTAETTPADIETAAASPYVAAVKYYPRGGTTNSESGVDGFGDLEPVVAKLEELDLPLLVHGERLAPGNDVFDREAEFIHHTLGPLAARHPSLRIVFEHITTAEAVAFVSQSSERIAATITPQHLLLNRNAIFEGGIRPHAYCLPVLKRESDREALLGAAISGNPKFFLGTDSAPHERSQKESSCGCAGIFSAPIAIEAYAEAFAGVDALDRLEGFASHFGADFYGLPRNTDRIRLERCDRPGLAADGEGDDAVEVFMAGMPLRYRVADGHLRLAQASGRISAPL